MGLPIPPLTDQLIVSLTNMLTRRNTLLLLPSTSALPGPDGPLPLSLFGLPASGELSPPPRVPREFKLNLRPSLQFQFETGRPNVDRPEGAWKLPAMPPVRRQKDGRRPPVEEWGRRRAAARQSAKALTELYTSGAAARGADVGSGDPSAKGPDDEKEAVFAAEPVKATPPPLLHWRQSLRDGYHESSGGLSSSGHAGPQWGHHDPSGHHHFGAPHGGQAHARPPSQGSIAGPGSLPRLNGPVGPARVSLKEVPRPRMPPPSEPQVSGATPCV